MRPVTDNLWWIFLAVSWTAYIIICLVWDEPLTAVLGVLSLAGLLMCARLSTNQRREIRYQQITIASLEQALKEAHRNG